MRRHYTRAPIVEAIIDMRVAWPQDAPLTRFDPIVDSLKAQFPTVRPIRTVEMGVMSTPDADPQFHTGHQNRGFRLDSGASDRVLQIQNMGFTYSHLAPYSEWATFRNEARTHWDAYVTATEVTGVIRVAVRVINKLTFAGPISELPKYTNLGLKVPADISLATDGYFAQIQMNAGARIEGCKVIINSGVAAFDDGKQELLLDFDIYREGQWEPGSPDLWQLLDRMSDVKDDIFESCITDATRSLIA